MQVYDIANVIFHLLAHSGDHNLDGAIDQDSLEAFQELFGVRSHSWNDDRDVSIGVEGVLPLRDWLVEKTSSDEVDNEPKVPEDEEKEEEHVGRREIDSHVADVAVDRVE